MFGHMTRTTDSKHMKENRVKNENQMLFLY